MERIHYRISLDMFDTVSQKTLKAKKGDTACDIIITLTENGKIYQIAEGCYATFTAKKPDGNFLYNPEHCRIENNTIVYEFTGQTTACKGMVDCEVILKNAEGNRLTSPRFSLIVGSTVYNGEDIFSTPEYDAMAILDDKVAETKEYAEGASTSAQEAEASAEAAVNAKTAAETAKASAEASGTNASTSETNAKASAESAKSSEDNARASAEAAETAQTAAENAKQAAITVGQYCMNESDNVAAYAAKAETAKAGAEEAQTAAEISAQSAKESAQEAAAILKNKADKWELINEATLTDNAEVVNFNKDKEGNAFFLKKFEILVSHPEVTSVKYGVWIGINGIAMAQTGNTSATAKNPTWRIWGEQSEALGWDIKSVLNNSNGTTNGNVIAYPNGHRYSGTPPTEAAAITVASNSNLSSVLAKGTVVKLWGVRK